MSDALNELIADNRLEKLDVYLFRGKASHDSGQRIYGGQVMAQAISAAQQSVDPAFTLHSFHGYFLRPGDVAMPVIYEVDPIRDGSSFVTRRIVAKQKGRAIFNCSTSFQRQEQGLSHQTEMPVVVPPDELKTDEELYRAVIPDSDYPWPIEFRQVDPMNFTDLKPKQPLSYTWFKAAGPVPEDPCIHQQLLAYASDNPILSTALRPHSLILVSPTVMVATLDHALWLHRPFRIDDWLLFESRSDSASGGRGIGHGRVFNRQGELVASAMQEGLVRLRSK
jgi:acyl-CoA thioesterase-2